jgi:2-alkenal reductase
MPALSLQFTSRRVSTARISAIALALTSLALIPGAVAQQAREVTPRDVLPAAEKQMVDLFERSAPSVAYIFTRITNEDVFGRRQVGAGAGSGFVWDRDGHIVTNNHVVEGADRVAVALDVGEPIPAKVIGTAPTHDIAVLQLENHGADLRPIPLGTSGDLKVGQFAFAIGNPYALSRTMTTGIISAVGRHLPTETGREIADVVQTDAAVNPGNSGGPLLDSAGRLIGMNTAIISGSGASAGIGFAIPADTINRVVPQLIANGRVPVPGIGVSVLPEDAATRFGAKGVVIAQVAPNSPAAKAGLSGIDPVRGRLGDVITEVNGKKVTNLAELAAELDRLGAGKKADLTVLRDGKPQKVAVDVVDIGDMRASR